MFENLGMSLPDPRALVVLTFDSPLKANEALMAMTRLQVEGAVLLHDAVLVRKDTDGTTHVTETVDVTPGDAAAKGSLWGALLGTLVAGPVGTLVGGVVTAGVSALAAKLTDIGVPDAMVKELEGTIVEGTTALALLVSHVNEDAFAKELERFAGATLLQSTLSLETVQRLRGALRRD